MNVVGIYGLGKSGKSSLVKSLLSLNASSGTAAEAAALISDGEFSSQLGLGVEERWKERRVLPLDTRYYTADVHLVVASSNDGAGAETGTEAVSPEVVGTEASEPSSLLAACQGLVVMVDLTRTSESLAHAERVYGGLKAAGGQAEVLLCVGTKGDLAMGAAPSAGSETKFVSEEAFLWSLDRGFEYVEVNLAQAAAEAPAGSAPAPGGLLSAANDEGEEKEGLERIAEAFQCHMWPSMTRKARAHGGASAAPHGGTGGGGALAGPGAVTGARGSAPAVPPSTLDDDPADYYKPMHDPDDEVTGDGNGDDAGTAPPRGASSPAGASTAAAAAAASGASGPSIASLRSMMEATLANLDNIGDGDDDESMLTRLMEQIQSVRARASQLPDEERRALAAQVAMSMAGLLGDDDDGDLLDGSAEDDERNFHPRGEQ